MSRTAFADRFRRRLGLTPVRYVTLWRMHKARTLLEHSARSVGEIAWEVGYASEAAFNRIFKAYFASPPGRYRHRQDDES